MSKKFIREFSRNAGLPLPEITFITMFIGKQNPKKMKYFAINIYKFLQLNRLFYFITTADTIGLFASL